MPQERKVRARPRMSAPKLGEYLYAEPGRRERLLLDQKSPPAFKTARYADAENAIRAALVSGSNVIGRLGESAKTVNALVTTTDWSAIGKRCCVQAIQGFAGIFDQLPTANAKFSLPSREAIMLSMEGVAVSVYPLVFSRREIRGSRRQGAILGVFQKNDPLDERALKAVAELLHRALIHAGHPDVHPAECVVVDVFSGKFSTATRQNQRIFANILSACREIAVRWPTLPPAIAA